MTIKQAAVLLGKSPRQAYRILADAGVPFEWAPTLKGGKPIAGPKSREYDAGAVMLLRAGMMRDALAGFEATVKSEVSP